jgi:hypothetical protein
MFLRIVGGRSRLLVNFFYLGVINLFPFQFGLSYSRLVPFPTGPRLFKTLVVCSRSVWGGSPATLFLSVPGVTLLAEASSSSFPVVIIVREVAPVVVPPGGGGRGSVEVLHFYRQRL